MTVRLRPHHLLCLLTYVGKGYSAAFIANYNRIARRLSRGEAIELVDGPDDICAPLLDEADPHCHRDSVTARDHKAARDLAEVLGQPVTAGAMVTLTEERLSGMRTAFAAGSTRKACSRCEWHELCTTVAAGGFAGVVVRR
jgi:hypothetical protein